MKSLALGLGAVTAVACGGVVHIGLADLDAGTGGSGGAGTMWPSGSGGTATGGSGGSGGGRQDLDATAGVAGSGIDVGRPKTYCENTFNGLDWIWFVFDASDEVPDEKTPRKFILTRPTGRLFTYLTEGRYADTEPSYSPNQRQISFTSNRAGKRQIFLLDTITHEVQQLTNLKDGAQQSRFSPDGKRIVFQSGGNIFTIDSAGSELMIADGTALRDGFAWPSFTDTSNIVVFQGDNELYAVRRDGSDLHKVLPPSNGSAQQPIAWEGSDPSSKPTDGGVALTALYAAECDGDDSEIYISYPWLMAGACESVRITNEPEGYAARHPFRFNSGFVYERIHLESGRSTLVYTDLSTYLPCELTPPTMDARNVLMMPQTPDGPDASFLVAPSDTFIVKNPPPNL